MPSLRVHVFEARDLEPKRRFKKTANPYAIVSVGSQTHQTTVVNKTLNPKFNQSYSFEVTTPDVEVLMIEVWDKSNSRFTKDKLIGRARFFLKDLYLGETNDNRMQLMGSHHGEIRIALLAVDFGKTRGMQQQPSYQQRRFTSTESYLPSFIPLDSVNQYHEVKLNYAH